MTTQIRIVFRDLNPVVVEAVQDAFADVKVFDIACADIFSAGAADAIISPANSYGWMDGGIDFVYLQRFGGDLQNRLMQYLAEHHGSRLPVGQAVVIATLSADIPWMISAPTMVLPGPVPDTQNAYLAFAASLRVARERGFQSVICPGLATWSGCMHPKESARQMRQAWDEVMA